MPRTPVTLDELKERLARRVRELAARRGLSHNALAAKAALHPRTVWNVLGGRSDTSLQSLVALAEALDVDPVALIRPYRGRSASTGPSTR